MSFFHVSISYILVLTKKSKNKKRQSIHNIGLAEDPTQCVFSVCFQKGILRSSCNFLMKIAVKINKARNYVISATDDGCSSYRNFHVMTLTLFALVFIFSYGYSTLRFFVQQPCSRVLIAFHKFYEAMSAFGCFLCFTGQEWWPVMRKLGFWLSLIFTRSV